MLNWWIRLGQMSAENLIQSYVNLTELSNRTDNSSVYTQHNGYVGVFIAKSGYYRYQVQC